ncbi:hypothetical protein [Paractinoplanes lichenicola]|uniref:DUF304 domain-containing protein n=1 Tax=Paractinoplanes lichenicola TaxID=2802976 RepID=A0ABS1VYJ2_9ACTN|nr:hypothetical protein [Actinoplanes lichenicola]MBL7259498.1 hypothetical protein [Actinoplanes lichenicola]
MWFFGAVARWRAWFLVAALALAVLLQTAFPLQLAGFGLTFGLMFLSFFGYLKYRPVTLDPVASPGLVLSAAAFTFLGTNLVSDDIGDLIAGRDDMLWWGDIPSGALWVLLVAYWWYLALGPQGVEIRADGVHDRQPLGRMFVPWEALGSATVGRRNEIFLRIVRPELVVRRGLRLQPSTINPVVDAGYLASVINARLETGDNAPLPQS